MSGSMSGPMPGSTPGENLSTAARRPRHDDAMTRTATRPQPRASWRALTPEQKQARLERLRERQAREVELEIRRLDALV